jgi:beta-lysine N6-acetyltransferase
MVEKFYGKNTLTSPNYSIDATFDYFNKRLIIDDFSGNVENIIVEMENLISNNNFEKVLCYIRKEDLFKFISEGFILEAIIYHYFRGSHAYIVTKYPVTERRNSNKWSGEDQLVSDVKKNSKTKNPLIPTDHIICKASTSDAEKLAQLYAFVFKIYPTPLSDSEYIKKLIKKGSIFYYIKTKGEIVSAASADINYTSYNAELTDCATHPNHRKHGFMKVLLKQLEQDLVQNRIYHVYSIARALSYGMNSCFYQLGYTYSGRLVNNCYIFDKLEDMNVWVKDLSLDAK